MMSRKAQILCLLVAAAGLLAAVIWFAARRGGWTSWPSAQATREVADMTGQRVSVPVAPRRVLSLCTSATDTLIALGATDRLVAIDEFSLVVPGSQKATVVGKGSAVSRESVAALQIDLAFIWWYQDDAAAMLRDLSIPAVRIRSGRAAELPATIRLVGECLGQQEAAEQLARPVELCVTQATTQPAGLRVYLELYGPYKTVGSETYTNDLLELAGCANVAAQTKGSVLLSAEKLVQADPDVMLCVGQKADAEAMSRRPGLSDLRAVRQGRVVALDRYWLVAGPGMPQSIEKIRNAARQAAAHAKD
jgi:iron complex transport system substrate-binding protein